MKIEMLRELVYIVNKYKTRQIDVIGNTSEKDSRYQQLYLWLLDENNRNEADLLHHFGYQNPSDAAYKKFLQHFQKRLLNTLFFIDVRNPAFSDLQRAYYSNYTSWAQIKILLGRTAHHSAIYLAHNLLEQALKFDMVDLVADIARALKAHYVNFEGSRRKYEYFKEMQWKYEENRRAEMLAEDYYKELIVEYVNSKATKKHLSEKAETCYQALHPLLQQYQSYFLQFYGYMILVTKWMSRNDYPATIAVCEEAIRYFENKPYHAKTPISTFLNQQLTSYIQLRQYTEAEKINLRSLELSDEGTTNWFKCLDLNVSFLLHATRFDEAYAVFQQASRHKRFHVLKESDLEIWKIYEAYLYYLIVQNKVASAPALNRSDTFRINRFLNTVPVFSKDKQGMNIPILIVQILLLISRRDYNAVLNRIEAIEKYCSRYLRQEGTRRSHYFIKMLLELPKAGFQRQMVKRNTTKQLQQLRNLPINLANQAHELEVLPYETLWEYLMEDLGGRK